jgi:hypothetical protein
MGVEQFFEVFGGLSIFFDDFGGAFGGIFKSERFYQREPFYRAATKLFQALPGGLETPA